MNILDKITGEEVQLAGAVGAGVSALLLFPPHVSLPIWALLWFVAEVCHSSRVAGWFHFLEGFAEVPAWPAFVALGVAVLLAGRQGGWRADVVLAFLLMTIDGTLFDALY